MCARVSDLMNCHFRINLWSGGDDLEHPHPLPPIPRQGPAKGASHCFSLLCLWEAVKAKNSK